MKPPKNLVWCGAQLPIWFYDRIAKMDYVKITEQILHSYNDMKSVDLWASTPVEHLTLNF